MVDKPDFTSLEKKILEDLDSVQIIHSLQKIKSRFRHSVCSHCYYEVVAAFCQMQQAANMDFLNGLARN